MVGAKAEGAYKQNTQRIKSDSGQQVDANLVRLRRSVIMAKEQDASSSVGVASIHAPTTIPEEPTPVSPASAAIPIDAEASDSAQQAAALVPSLQPEIAQQQQTQPASGRFIEIISSDGSRASAENDAEPQPKQFTTASKDVLPATERQARPSKSGSNIFRRASKRKSVQSTRADTLTSPSQPAQAANVHAHCVSPSTEGSTQKTSPSPNGLSSPSDEDGRHHRAFKKINGETSDTQEHTSHNDRNCNHDGDTDKDDQQHSILDALYPLTNFIGYRPLSHPHTPAERRLTSKHPRFNRYHYICGCIFSLGLPVSGETGEIARYRDPHTGKIELVRMYKDQVGAKIVNSIHSIIAAWVVIALLSLVSRSPFHRAHDAPLIIGAFATEAVVTFYGYRTPLAQPKNILFGNTISAVMGVAMTKAFASTTYSVSGIYGVDWAAAATAVSAAVFAMQIFGFTHPPGAAISLLAITDPKTHELDWWLVPIVIIGTLIVIGWALIINNLGGRRYPDNWFYVNAFAEPPIIGPEKLPFSNSPYYLPSCTHGHKRKPCRKQGEEAQEKGFYRVPDSGVRLTHGFGSSTNDQLEPRPKSNVTATAGHASYSLGGAARVRHLESVDSQVASGSKQSLSAGVNEASAEDGRTTRASEITKVNSLEAPAVLSSHGYSAMHQQQQESAVASTTAKSAPSTAAAAPPAPQVKSRMIEADPTLVSRNNSKSSRRSRRSIVVHVNESRRHSTGSTTKASPVPAVQWRDP